MIQTTERYPSPVILRAIAELENPLKDVLRQLRGPLYEQEYGFILADDRSGRLPALILRKVINAVYAKHQPPLPLIFVKGRKYETDLQHMQDEFSRAFRIIKTQTPNKRVLLVTEHIHSGLTVRNFRRVLDSNDMEFDVCALTIHLKEKNYRQLGYIPKNSNLFFYPNLKEAPTVSSMDELTGLGKGRDNEQIVIQKERNPDIRRLIILARSGVNNLSSRLISSTTL